MNSIREHPNVLVFIPHDLGDYLGCYGHQDVKSPNLDALAAKGVHFTNFFTTAAECSPSRGSLWTGLYPHQNGLMGLANWGWNFYSNVLHLAERLRRFGYETHLFGFQHETSSDPTTLGYQNLHSQSNSDAKSVCSALREFLRSSQSHKNCPWFACCGFSDVHRSWKTETTFDSAEVEVPQYLPDTTAIRRDFTLFYQNILEMDDAIAWVLDELRSSGLERETLVIFTTDHGCPFPRAKSTFYDPGIRVPLILHWPGVIEGGHVYDCLLSNLDVAPTLLEICGSDIPEELEGRSFKPLLLGEPYEERKACFGSLFYDVSYDPMHYVRTRTHKYIRSFAVTPEDAAGADSEVIATHKAGIWIRLDDLDVMTSPAWQSIAEEHSKPPPEELYELTSDPFEQKNLADEKAAEEVLKQMRTLLRDMMEHTSSPLLDRHVAPPAPQRQLARDSQPGGPKYRNHLARRLKRLEQQIE